MKSRILRKLIIGYIIFIVLILITNLDLINILYDEFCCKIGLIDEYNINPKILIKEDKQLEKIDFSDLFKLNGNVEILSSKYNIMWEKGSEHEVGYKYSKKEFFDLIDDYKIRNHMYNNDYVISAAYSDKFDSFLVIRIPYDYNVIEINNKFYVENMMNTIIRLFVFFITTMIIIPVIILYIYNYIIINKYILTPINILNKYLIKIPESNYMYKIDYKFNSDFDNVKNTINKMTEKLKKEIDFRKNLTKNRQQFIVDIAHDIKNPLTSIIGYSDIILNNNNNIPSQYIKIIKDNSIRVKELMKDFNYMIDIKDSKFHIEYQKFDLCKFINEYISNNKYYVIDKNFIIDCNIPKNKILIKSNKKYLWRVVNNIVNNSIKHNITGTKIYIKVSEIDNSFVEIIIEDNGKGLGPSKNEISLESSGLGLSITRFIVEKLKGILINDKKYTCGTRFRIILKKDF